MELSLTYLLQTLALHVFFDPRFHHHTLLHAPSPEAVSFQFHHVLQPLGFLNLALPCLSSSLILSVIKYQWFVIDKRRNLAWLLNCFTSLTVILSRKDKNPVDRDTNIDFPATFNRSHHFKRQLNASEVPLKTLLLIRTKLSSFICLWQNKETAVIAWMIL